MCHYTAKPDLDAYLRLNRAAESEWLAAIRELLASDEVQTVLSRPQAVVGSLSSLAAEQGTLGVLDMAQDTELHLTGLPATLMVVPVAGQCDVLLEQGCKQSAFPAAVLKPGQSVVIHSGECARLVLLTPKNVGVGGELCPGRLARMADQVHRFLQYSGFFRNHGEACRSMDELLERLLELALGVQDNPGEAPGELDRRLVRVIDKIHDEPAWEFDLQELASHSGVSERNLYYLMKRETGMTPYRYYQRCRLVRVRRRLVDCQCDVPHISWYAADEGFTHLGRFAALYREHFGELPSETVQWRRRLQVGEIAPESPRGIVAS
ncbi:helix-turn-helix domain-containing protein [Marinobacter sp. VGCF2001]|uniref:helix-turn-helix domain-containing protein n=1 Tax=Marinobacter sp. VGCF2001 TaxID=3417189 RepID=UPI003CE80D48